MTEAISAEVLSRLSKEEAHDLFRSARQRMTLSVYNEAFYKGMEGSEY